MFTLLTLTFVGMLDFADAAMQVIMTGYDTSDCSGSPNYQNTEQVGVCLDGQSIGEIMYFCEADGTIYRSEGGTGNCATFSVNDTRTSGVCAHNEIWFCDEGADQTLQWYTDSGCNTQSTTNTNGAFGICEWDEGSASTFTRERVNSDCVVMKDEYSSVDCSGAVVSTASEGYSFSTCESYPGGQYVIASGISCTPSSPGTADLGNGLALCPWVYMFIATSLMRCM